MRADRIALKQAEAGTQVGDVIRRIEILEQPFYGWKKVYGGLGVGKFRRVNQLQGSIAGLGPLIKRCIDATADLLHCKKAILNQTKIW